MRLRFAPRAVREKAAVAESPQMGIERLDTLLRRLNDDAPAALARLFDQGGKHALQRLSLHRARALAAVTSHEIENISAAVAALGMHDDLRTILRAGRGEVVNETRSLFRIGVVRDVYRIGGTLLAAAALGSTATAAFLHEQTVYEAQAEAR